MHPHAALVLAIEYHQLGPANTEPTAMNPIELDIIFTEVKKKPYYSKARLASQIAAVVMVHYIHRIRPRNLRPWFINPVPRFSLALIAYRW